MIPSYLQILTFNLSRQSTLYQHKYFSLDQSNGKMGAGYIKKKQVYLIQCKFDIARSV